MIGISDRALFWLRLRGLVVAMLLAVSPPHPGASSEPGCSGLRIDAMQWTPEVASSWSLLVEAGGKAVIRVGGVTEYRLQLSDAVCSEIVRSVRKEGFFELRKRMQSSIIDGEVRQLEITVGRERNSITLTDYSSLTEREQAAVKRAVRVWIAVRGLFSVPGAADSREEDRAFLAR